MYKFIFVLVLFAVELHSQTPSNTAWVNRGTVVGAVDYFTTVMQELGYELERREWCNLKVVDVTRNVNLFIANWNVTGTINYTNGFVISVQKIEVSSVIGFLGTMTEDNATVPIATVRGRLHFRHVNMGYDVVANLTDIGIERYTGEIMNNNVVFEYSVRKNLLTGVMTSTSGLVSVEGGFNRMIFRPTSHLTEVLSRIFTAADNWNGVGGWHPMFREILFDIATNKVEFPQICFNDC